MLEYPCDRMLVMNALLVLFEGGIVYFEGGETDERKDAPQHLVLGTLLFLLILGAMTVDSLSQVASARTPQLTDQVVADRLMQSE